MIGSSSLKRLIGKATQQEGQQVAPKGFLRKFVNSPKLDPAQRSALMDAMSGKAPSRANMSASPMGRNENTDQYRHGGKIKKKAKGGAVSSASKRADGCATKGKTKGRFV